MCWETSLFLAGLPLPSSPINGGNTSPSETAQRYQVRTGLAGNSKAARTSCSAPPPTRSPDAAPRRRRRPLLSMAAAPAGPQNRCVFGTLRPAPPRPALLSRRPRPPSPPRSPRCIRACVRVPRDSIRRFGASRRQQES
jgi:hypothetical protein